MANKIATTCISHCRQQGLSKHICLAAQEGQRLAERYAEPILLAAASCLKMSHAHCEAAAAQRIKKMI